MREIKFGVWDEYNKKWIYFSLESLFSDLLGRKKRPEIVELWHARNYELKVCRFIGLKDKNGKEIYEGDIVKCKLSSTQRYKGIIQFKTGHFFIHAFWYSFKPIGRWDLEKRKLCGKSSTNLNIDCEMQIIGNIHENPELLEKK